MVVGGLRTLHVEYSGTSDNDDNSVLTDLLRLAPSLSSNTVGLDGQRFSPVQDVQLMQGYDVPEPIVTISVHLSEHAASLNTISDLSTLYIRLM
jgi:hypothetical protein